MKGHNDGHLGRNLGDGFEQSAENALVIDVLGPMQGEKRVVRGDPEALRGAAGTRRVGGAEQRVDHGVAHEFDAIVRDPLMEEVLPCVPARREEERRQVIAETPVDLLRHVEVVAAKAGLDVGDRVVLLRGDEGAGEGRVDVADDDHDRGVETAELRLERGHDPRGLLGVAAGAHAEMSVRLGQAQLGEENVRELGVVVLAGVHERGGEAASARRPRPPRPPS